MKHHANWSLLLSLFIIATLSSCKEENIANDIGGVWHRDYTATNEDQSKSNVDVYWKFEKTPNENSGTFFEVLYVEVLYDDEPSENYKWTSRIDGTWQIESGNLHLIYGSQLLVGIEKENHNTLILPEVFFNDNLWMLAFYGALDYKLPCNEKRFEIYTALQNSYSELNVENDEGIDGITYPSVEITKNVLSCHTPDGLYLATFDKVENTLDEKPCLERYYQRHPLPNQFYE